MKIPVRQKTRELIRVRGPVQSGKRVLPALPESRTFLEPVTAVMPNQSG